MSTIVSFNPNDTNRKRLRTVKNGKRSKLINDALSLYWKLHDGGEQNGFDAYREQLRQRVLAALE